MGKAKENKLGEKVYTLTQREFDYLKLLNIYLNFHIAKDKLISGFLYYICNQRLGYGEDVNLTFEIDLEDEKRELKIREIPTEAIESALSPQEYSEPPQPEA